MRHLHRERDHALDRVRPGGAAGVGADGRLGRHDVRIADRPGRQPSHESHAEAAHRQRARHHETQRDPRRAHRGHHHHVHHRVRHVPRPVPRPVRHQQGQCPSYRPGGAVLRGHVVQQRRLHAGRRRPARQQLGGRHADHGQRVLRHAGISRAAQPHALRPPPHSPTPLESAHQDHLGDDVLAGAAVAGVVPAGGMGQPVPVQGRRRGDAAALRGRRGGNAAQLRR